MHWYLLLLKIDPNRTEETAKRIQELPKNPTPNVNMCSSFYVFGAWDACLWFCTNNHEDAMNFVQKNIRPIPGINETYLMPTTPINEYK